MISLSKAAFSYSTTVAGAGLGGGVAVVVVLPPCPPGPYASRSATSFCFSANIVLSVLSCVSSFSILNSDFPSGAAESWTDVEKRD